MIMTKTTITLDETFKEGEKIDIITDFMGDIRDVVRHKTKEERQEEKQNKRIAQLEHELKMLKKNKVKKSH